jgi:Peptidase family M23
MKGLALLLPVLVALQVGVQPALAWAWPVDGPVLRSFVLGDDPYAGGQHRGIDIGAPAGAPVRAPAAGTVSFAGTVPSGGKTVTIRTGDGYAVTLLHLGEYLVARGAVVGEGETIGSVGPSGAAVETQPFVYLGVRVAADPNGYVDPLGLLPAPALPANPEPSPPVTDPAPSDAGGAKAHHSAPASPPTPSPGHAGPQNSVESPDPVHVALQVEGHSGSAPPHRSHAVSSATPAAVLSKLSVHAPPVGSGVVAGVARDAARRSGSRPWPAVLVGAAIAAGALGAARVLVRRRQLSDAGTAYGPAAVLRQRGASAAEHTDGLRLGEKNRLVLHGDLERILLAQRKALADLDRDDDAPELVDVTNDARSRRSSCRPRGHSIACSFRPHRVVGLSRGHLATSPRHAISNHHFGGGSTARPSYDCHA